MSALLSNRDTRLTERLDYCSANAVVALSLICVLARALWPRLRVAAAGSIGFVLTAVAMHLRYMLCVCWEGGWPAWEG